MSRPLAGERTREGYDPARPGQYRPWLETFGLDIRVAGWGNLSEAEALYAALMEGVPPGTVLDVGCNLGFLADYLAGRGIVTPESYDGIDCLPFLVAAARQRLPLWRFHAAYLDEWHRPADYVVACAVLNYGPAEHIEQSLVKLWGLTQKMLALNTSGGGGGTDAAGNVAIISALLTRLVGRPPLWQKPAGRGYVACRIHKTV